MVTRAHAPAGSPCWVDLWTSDVGGSRAFYGELLGWESGEPDPEFGGYFIFTRQGVDIAGCMGDMGEGMEANDTWKVYLATDDINATTEAAEAAGAEILAPAMPVGELGIQTVLVDPTGANLGAWEEGTFPGGGPWPRTEDAPSRGPASRRRSSTFSTPACPLAARPHR
jgi:predicted enzyme related to lactoylglutathione lyase